LEPAPGAVDRLADDEHGEQKHDAGEDERGREQAERAVAAATEHEEQGETDERVEPLLAEVVRRVAARQRSRGRRRAVDHDEAERDER
jgi:hypothetical protein